MKYAKPGLKTSIKDNFGARMRILARLRQRRSNFCKKMGRSHCSPSKSLGALKALKALKPDRNCLRISDWWLDVTEG